MTHHIKQKNKFTDAMYFIALLGGLAYVFAVKIPLRRIARKTQGS